MEPAFYRGDILFLTNPTHVPYEVGDITVYKVYVHLRPLAQKAGARCSWDHISSRFGSLTRMVLTFLDQVVEEERSLSCTESSSLT